MSDVLEETKEIEMFRELNELSMVLDQLMSAECEFDERYYRTAPGSYEWCGGRDEDGVPDGGDVQWSPDEVWLVGA